MIALDFAMMSNPAVQMDGFPCSSLVKREFERSSH